ncbi:Pif1p [Rhizophagus irregularis DAOM 197198w]|uniref:ATP-dependent DNA helicase n=1 Tax=Rhizophagus irregularis (strain DAOM 197198w) TaxID=1432141 RepID=A0A015L7K5_RHIIW|nr:Pif1p [Rhizophagus irregularis DAOM 197198w]
MGTAGTGKSYLINIIRERLQENSIVLAPTGVAAFNIQGSIIHSALSVPILCGTDYKLEGESLKKLQNRIKDIKYLIIDEMSMRNGALDDWELLMTRIPEKLPESERKKFSNSINILTTWEEVDRINADKLRSLNQPVAKIGAVHTGGSEAWKAE